MKDKYYINKNTKVYKIIQEVKMSNGNDSELKDYIIYTDGNTTYCKEKKIFLDEFKLVDNEQCKSS